MEVDDVFALRHRGHVLAARRMEFCRFYRIARTMVIEGHLSTTAARRHGVPQGTAEAILRAVYVRRRPPGSALLPARPEVVTAIGKREAA